MAVKMRQDTWETLPRNVKHAYLLYPAQAPEWAQDEMRRRAANEGKQPPRNLPDPTPTPTPRAGRIDYGKVPGLVRRPVR